jgi:hypothetical protein
VPCRVVVVGIISIAAAVVAGFPVLVLRGGV